MSDAHGRDIASPLSHHLQESGAATLDVHVPHATHTWKDFFIHIATICVGLLIAIVLEQGVELLHHRSQASRLEEDLRKEADQNVRIIDSDNAVDCPEMAWASSAMQALRDAPLHRGFVAVVLPPAPPVSKTYAVGDTVMNTTPSHSVWTIAQSTGQVELLPLNRAKVYDRLEFEATQYVVVANASDIEGTKFAGVLRSLNVNFDPGETLHLTAAHRDDLVQALNRHTQLRYWAEVRLSFWKGASKAVLDGVQNVDDVLRYMDKESSAIKQP